MATPVLRALVTRPLEEAEGLAAALATRGVEALVEPLIEVRFPPPQALDLATVQAVLCTSANGVRALARATSERGVTLLAVGDATASRAREEGFAAVESAGGDVGDLARLAVTRLRPQQGPLLHVAGNVVAGDLAGLLRAQGFTVGRRVLYVAQAAAALSPAAVDNLRAGAVSIALFFSPRTATIFARLAGNAGVAQRCAKITAVSISAAADAALGTLPWRDRRVAERPNQQALLDRVDGILGEARGIG